MTLVVEGARSWSGGGLAFAAVIVAGIGEIVLAETRTIPSILPSSAVGSITFVAAVVFSFFSWRRSIARAGRVVLGVSAIRFTRGRKTADVLWTDLQGYRDGEAEFVELIRAPRAPITPDFPRLTIPTATETDRVAVLEALDRHGLRRVE